MSVGMSGGDLTGSAINTVGQPQANQFNSSLANASTPGAGFGEDFNLPAAGNFNLDNAYQNYFKSQVGPGGYAAWQQQHPGQSSDNIRDQFYQMSQDQQAQYYQPGGPQLALSQSTPVNLPQPISQGIASLQANPVSEPIVNTNNLNPGIQASGPQLGFGENFNLPAVNQGPTLGGQPVLSNPPQIISSPVLGGSPGIGAPPITQQPQTGPITLPGGQQLDLSSVIQPPVMQQPMIAPPQPVVRPQLAQPNPFARFGRPNIPNQLAGSLPRPPAPAIQPQMPTRAAQGYQSRLPQGRSPGGRPVILPAPQAPRAQPNPFANFIRPAGQAARYK